MSNTKSVNKDGIQGFNPHDLFANGFNLETVDLIQGGSFKEVIGRTVVALLLSVRSQAGKRPFSGVSVIIPPLTATMLSTETVFQSLVDAIITLRGSKPDTEELKFLQRIVRVVICSSLEIADLEATVAKEGQGRLIAIAEADRYRDQSITTPPVFGISAVRTSEDLWVPHVSALCRLCVAIVKNTGGYAVVHVTKLPASRPENEKQLTGIDDCYVCCLMSEEDPEVIFNQRMQLWLSMILCGSIEEVKKEIDGLQVTNAERLMVLAQLLIRAEKHREVLDLVEQMQPQLVSFTSAQMTQLANIVHKAGDDFRAHALLPANAGGLSEELWLEVALELSTQFKDNVRIEQFDTRLSELFPLSNSLRENRDRRLLLNCRFSSQDGNQLFTTSGFTDYHMVLLDGILVSHLDYEEISEQAKSWGIEWFELALICCAMNAHSLGNSRDAANVASRVTSSNVYGRQAAQVVLSSVRNMMLKEELSGDEREYYRDHLQSVINFSAHHSGDTSIRKGLSKLLSVESCGDLGIPLIALTMLDLARKGVRFSGPGEERSEIVFDDVDTSSNPNEEAILEVAKRALNWLNEEHAAELGVTVLPVELVGDNPDYIVKYISHKILPISSQHGEDVDFTFIESMVVLVCAMCPHASKNRNEDIWAMRILASHYAIAGQFQRAREIAEQVLLVGQVGAVRQRLAWLAFSDVHNRCRNQVEALIGLACALATDAPLEKADLYQEVNVAVRIFRDLGLVDLARKFLPALKQLLSDCGLDAETDPNIVFTELTLRSIEIENTDVDKIKQFLSEITELCGSVMNNRIELVSNTLLLGQVVRKAHNAGIQIPSKTSALLKQMMSQLGEQGTELVESLSSTAPSASLVTSMFNKVQRSVYAADAGADYLIVGLAARRLLNGRSHELSAISDNALAVEILVDQTVQLPEFPPDMKIDWPVRYAQELNKEGLEVLFLALDDTNELVVTLIKGGQIFSIEQPHYPQSFKHRMMAWLEEYPRQYGYVYPAYDNNDFFTTMEKLDVRLIASESLLVVAEPFLQQLAFNLVLVESENTGSTNFLGVKSAVGMVPSLTWLSRIRANPRSSRDEYKAWISAEEYSEESGSLDIVLSRLEGTFEDFGFKVDTNSRLPRNISDAHLAVITAHGGLTTDGRYIHSIRDEGDLVEAPSALAQALAGVDVVILFVCSGGRLDKHPLTNRTVGLPKQLIDLGCKAVIASPWSLDVKVTYRWLEPFLRGWEAGLTTLSATKEANEAVVLSLGDNPQYSLAMSVYGDILLTKQSIMDD
jgi:hypothetical protein